MNNQKAGHAWAWPGCKCFSIRIVCQPQLQVGWPEYQQNNETNGELDGAYLGREQNAGTSSCIDHI
jgi:hypothetical protein